MSDDYEIVYSCDGSGENKVKKKKKEVVVDVDPSQTTLKIRLEKKGRGGKTVTVVYELPNNQKYFKKLAKELKSFCGTGGAQKPSQIEIQGDQREKVREFLVKKGFKVLGN